ncbi:MAG TPA: sulfatase [Gemmatimonadaceae bacterium]|nr:sulfatase [Gemmatimonadaceae bacterium]
MRHTAAIATCGMLLASLASAASAQMRPNIVFLFADDHAAHALSAYRSHLRYGADLPPTPHLDRLASDGMLFVNSFVTNSICAPSRATVLTGQYGHVNGVMTNLEPLHPASVTFPRLLQEAGYQTALFGKWHLKTGPVGYDRYEILASPTPYYNPSLISGADTARYTGYTLDVVTQRALRWLGEGRSAAAPFLLMLHFNAPHRWWDPGPDQLTLYRDTTFAEPSTLWDSAAGRASPARDPQMKIALDLTPRDLKLKPPENLTAAQREAWDRAYAAENGRLHDLDAKGDDRTRWNYQRYIADYMRVVSALDAQVGAVLDSLAALGLDDSTLVVYSSDQGFFLGDHGWFDKRWMYEESLRTPLLARWPGVIERGTVNRDLVMNLDLAQTFLELAGVASPPSMQGRSLAQLLRGESPAGWRDAIYYQYFEYPGWHMVRRQYGVRTHRYKLIHYYETGEWELFDLERDPEELTSVYASPEYATVVTDMKETMARLRAEYAAPEADPVPYIDWTPPAEYRRAPLADDRIGSHTR